MTDHFAEYLSRDDKGPTMLERIEALEDEGPRNEKGREQLAIYIDNALARHEEELAVLRETVTDCARAVGNLIAIVNNAVAEAGTRTIKLPR